VFVLLSRELHRSERTSADDATQQTDAVRHTVGLRMFLSTLERLSPRHRFSLLGLVVALLVGPPCAGWMSRQLEERVAGLQEGPAIASLLGQLRSLGASALATTSAVRCSASATRGSLERRDAG
jgi:hypothetical protein